MYRMLARRKTLVFILLFFSAIPILMSIVRLVQIPLGALPLDAAEFLPVPVWHWFHALAGASFGVLGPLQFGGVLQQRFGLLHRVIGRVFVAAGLVLGVSGLGIFFQIENASSIVADGMRVAAGAALIVALVVALWWIRRGNVPAHRAWMIRAYAIGMGSGAVSIVFFPIFLVLGNVDGLTFDVVFVGCWLACIAIAEAVNMRMSKVSMVRG
jgi:uncharacterized membrane protein YozB (DUF420 family)